MRTDHNFPVDKFIAEASTLRRLDGVSAGVRITVHEAGMQDTQVRPMHLHDQAMWLKPDFGVNPMGTSGVEDSIERGERGQVHLSADFDGARAGRWAGRVWERIRLQTIMAIEHLPGKELAPRFGQASRRGYG